MHETGTNIFDANAKQKHSTLNNNENILLGKLAPNFFSITVLLPTQHVWKHGPLE